MTPKALDLFHAYQENKILQTGGYILYVKQDTGTIYSSFECIAYQEAKSIYLSSAGLTFKADGKKIWMLVEPSTFSDRTQSPCERQPLFHIPHRFDELHILTTDVQTRIMISKKPILTFAAFTVPYTTDNRFAFLFFSRKDTGQILQQFILHTLIEEASVPVPIAQTAASLTVGPLLF